MLTRRHFAALLAAAASAQPLPYSTIAEAAQALRRRQTTSLELTNLCLKRIAATQPRLNAFTSILADSARAEAAAADRELAAGRPRGPLHGIPIAVKDLLDTKGVPTTAASRHWANNIPTQDAPALAKLREAGAVLLGKLNMDEFAYNFSGETSSFGTSRNPWNTAHSPGGSSGGSAVAIAAGLCLGTVGSDTGGSIRLPAAFCGVTGLKGTYGAINTAGAAVLAGSLDHLGPLARTAEDAARLSEAMGAPPIHEKSVKPKSLRLGIARQVFWDGVDAETSALLAEAIKTLGALTAGARDVTLPPLERSPVLAGFPHAYVEVISAESYAYHAERLKTHPELFDPVTKTNLAGGAEVTPARYQAALAELHRLRANPASWFRQADILVMPTAPGPAFAFGKKDLVFLRNAAQWNLLGFPALSIPCGFTKDNLPVGLQLVAAPNREDQLIAAANAYQRQTDWHRKTPRG
jgi:aspartyl-tRNA(Asn)/glutamyl-tRNA(Gln) amidotransferase subunit A